MWYGGRENKPLAQIIFSYLGKGKVNHRVTFSEFITVIRELHLAKTHVNLFIFKLIAEGRPQLTILQLLRQFVCTPKDSPFALELHQLIRHHLDTHLLLRKVGYKRSSEAAIVSYDYYKFRTLIPYSTLAAELMRKFVDMPKLAFDKEGRINQPYFDDVSEDELEERRQSCMFSPDPTEHDPNATAIWRESQKMWNQMRKSNQFSKTKSSLGTGATHDAEIRRHADLFKLNMNEENLDNIAKSLIRAERKHLKELREDREDREDRY